MAPEPSPSGSVAAGRRVALAAALLLVGFNLWHTANRSTWNGSLGDALTLGPRIRDFAARFDPSLRSFKPYDGQYYYAIAFDPAVRTREVVPLLDDARYRYRRILLPALASALALGEPNRFPATLMLTNVAAWILCGFAAWRLGKRCAPPAPWLSVGVLVTTGLVYATFRTMPEPVALALLLFAVDALARGRLGLSGLLFGLAALAREDALVAAAAAGLYALWRERRLRAGTLLFGLAALAPAALWWSYLALRLPPGAASLADRIGWPFLALWQESLQALSIHRTRTDLVRTLSLNAEAVVLSVAIFLGYRRHPSLWGALALAQALLCVTLRGDVWTYWAGSARVLVPLTVFTLFWLLEHAARPVPASLAARAARDRGTASGSATFESTTSPRPRTNSSTTTMVCRRTSGIWICTGRLRHLGQSARSSSRPARGSPAPADERLLPWRSPRARAHSRDPGRSRLGRRGALRAESGRFAVSCPVPGAGVGSLLVLLLAGCAGAPAAEELRFAPPEGSRCWIHGFTA